MIDPADMRTILEAVDQHLNDRLVRLEARVAAVIGSLNAPRAEPEAPMVLVRSKPNAPPHGENGEQRK